MNTYKSVLLLNCGLFLLPLFIQDSSASSCNFEVTVKQMLLNDGFHRNLTYGIVFNSLFEDKWLYEGCTIGLEQNLPAGVYINPDEVNDLKRMHKLNIILKNRVNIELPSEQATPSNVYIISDVVDGKAYLWLPVHARYHQAVSGGGMARNEIGPPKLHLRCRDRRLDLCHKMPPAISFLCNGSSREECNWKIISYTMMTDTLIWQVPVGNTDHYYMVAAGTAAILVLGSLYLLKSIHDYKIDSKKKPM